MTYRYFFIYEDLGNRDYELNVLMMRKNVTDFLKFQNFYVVNKVFLKQINI